jgi:uncharacterized protein YjbI with pentapeptide repeats
MEKEALMQAKGNPMNKILDLTGSEQANDETLANLPPEVETLSLSCCPNFTKEGLESLQNAHLRSLNLFGCNLVDEDLAELPDNLEDLNLSRCKNIGKKTMKRLKQMTSLRSLNLSDTSIGDDLIQAIPKQLLRLNLSCNPFSGKALEAIADMNDLHELYLTALDIRDEDLGHLPNSLIELRLDLCTALTHKGIAPLAKRENLRSLSLLRCPSITLKTIGLFSKTKIRIRWQPPAGVHLAMQAFG